MTKIPPKPNSGVLQRFCKKCGLEYSPQKKGRLCPACKAESKKQGRKEYYWANKQKELEASKEWSKNNPRKNRKKALAHYHRKKVLDMLATRTARKKLVRSSF